MATTRQIRLLLERATSKSSYARQLLARNDAQQADLLAETLSAAVAFAMRAILSAEGIGVESEDLVSLEESFRDEVVAKGLVSQETLRVIGDVRRFQVQLSYRAVITFSPDKLRPTLEATERVVAEIANTVRKSDPGTVANRVSAEGLIRDTEIPAWAIVAAKKRGRGEDEILEDFESLELDDLDAAWDYYRDHLADVDRHADDANRNLEIPTAAPGPGAAPYEQWKQRFDEMLAQAEPLISRLPPGYSADDSRESIYEGRGE